MDPPRFSAILTHLLLYRSQRAKEPHNLLDDAVLSGEGKAEYAGLYKHARPDQRLGDASTGYTKLPTNLGVPQRSSRLG